MPKKSRYNKYKRSFPMQVVKHVEENKPLEVATLARKFGVTRECIYYWARTHREFGDAIRYMIDTKNYNRWGGDDTEDTQAEGDSL